MKGRRVIRKEVTDDGAAVNVAAVISSGETHSVTSVRSKQRVVQRSGRTRVETEQELQSDTEGRGK